MKNVYYHWLHPPLLGMVMLGMVWFVADPETTRYMPGDSLIRLYTILAVIIFGYFFHFINRTVSRYFISKNKGMKTGVEYTIILLVSTVIIALVSLFFTFFVNHQSFSWFELVKNCGLIVPILFLNHLVVRNIHIKEEYNRQTLQLEQIKNNQLETELKYLRAQYHPHFLFNALNTIYFQIDDKNKNAKNTVELLSELLRYQLYSIENKVNISEEINFIKSYIQFQQLRMTERLTMTTCFDNALNKQKIYPLIYQPFLENAFKYVGGKYHIHLEMKLIDKQIRFHLENSLPEQNPQSEKMNAGIGSENIKRRLALLYPGRHWLNIQQEEKSFFVELIVSTDADED